ncbi:MAG: DUF998 domain-containing protein [bacterium]
MPLLYFGVQLIAAPFYPGYSFLARDASTLGSPGSTHPAIFNLGSIVTGVVTLVAALGFHRAFDRFRIHPALTWLATLALVGSAVGSINAGLHPLPDPLHTSGILSVLGMGLFLLPLLLPIAVWRMDNLSTLRRYLVINLMLVIALIPIMGGLVQRWSMMAGVELPKLQSILNNDQGALQRVAAFALFVPIGVTAAVLATRLTTSRN